jgi:hypothetical protein
MISIARSLIIFGLILTVVGLGIYLISKTGIQLGRLPGDIEIQGRNLTCIVPLAASIFLSIILTLLLNIAVRILR